jgi:hypothetical protein
MNPKLLIALTVVAVIIGLVGYNMRAGRNEKLIEAPAVDDKYIADFSSFLKGVPPQTWGVLKVVAVRGDRVELAVSKKAYNKSKGPERDYDNGAANTADYYEAQTLTLPHAALKAAVKDNTIRYIRR